MVILQVPEMVYKMDIENIRQNLKSKKITIREKAVDELALAQDPNTVSELIWVLKNDKAGSVRRRAVLALARIGDEKCKDVLYQTMMLDRDNETRKNAAITLGNFGDERAILPLYEFLQEPRKNSFSDNLDRARINKVLIELAQKKMVRDVEELIDWRKERIKSGVK
ncbi:MAG: HEAT repeat domain-containing protein [Asgard group archaeon]|nr:HEAT repeat domain-containing protein [Asgard group archaeon]